MAVKIEETILLDLIKSRAATAADLGRIKRKAAKKYGVSCPQNARLIAEYHRLKANKRIRPDVALEYLLRKRKVRSLSGVAVVAVLTRPYPCGGKCIYCPTQQGAPKSYLDGEPAVMRALQHKYDPYEQVHGRIKTLEENGHPTDKIDLRIIGGTWSYNPKNYQEWFVKRCFEACNNYGKKDKTCNENLEILQKKNENAKHRVIGLNIETRPDCINTAEARRLRGLGVTHVEIGVQSVYDDVLSLNKRGHGIDATIKATKLLKDAGFKICYHIMPNLPGSTPSKDIQTFKQLFENPDFKPDHLKIYPCALVTEAPLYWIKDRIGYRSYSASELANILIQSKAHVPYYCRIQRIIRDIPAPYITAGGTKVSNLRQVIEAQMKKQGLHCKCIRCREVKDDYNPREKLKFFRENYDASGGKEIFLSFENKNRSKLYSLLRLRIPSFALRASESKTLNAKPLFPVLKGAALIREIHTYGQLHPIQYPAAVSGEQFSGNSPQHKGMGKKLMTEAERIAAKEFKLKKIAVISGVGTRNYYRKLGYRLKDTYMTKNIN